MKTSLKKKPAKLSAKSARTPKRPAAKKKPRASLDPVIQIQSVELASIGITRENPRYIFDEEPLRELANSLQLYGMLQPVIVRRLMPTPGEGERFELIAGERRIRAARMLNWQRVPAIAWAVDDATARRMRMIENLQRVDLSAFEEALGFEELLKDGMSVEDLASAIHKTRQHVYNTLKLMRLPQVAVEALKAGHLGRYVASLIGRIEDRAKRQEAAAAICGDEDMEPMSQREAVAWLRNNGGKPLLEAPWDMEDTLLVPAAGCCTACPKRCHLAEDARQDTCTDADCWESKRLRALELQREEFQAQGMNVIEPDEHFDRWGAVKFDSAYVELDEPPAAHLLSSEARKEKNQPTWSELLPDDVQKTIVFSHSGAPRALVPLAAAIPAAKKAGHDIFARTAGTDYEQQERDRRAGNKEDQAKDREEMISAAIQRAQERDWTRRLLDFFPWPEGPSIGAGATSGTDPGYPGHVFIDGDRVDMQLEYFLWLMPQLGIQMPSFSEEQRALAAALAAQEIEKTTEGEE